LADLQAIIHGFALQLDDWEREYEGRPQDEMTRLWLLALEREHLVTVAYRRDVIHKRLSGMPVEPRVRSAVQRAIRWAWRDEEMHALYIRGALLREGSLPERAKAWLTQVEGRVAGWTSSRQVHNRWRHAPMTRLVAELLEVAGHATGRIPPEVRAELQFNRFCDWCHFAVAAERTAGMGWARMAELGPAAGCTQSDIDAFVRMKEDERRHSLVFELFADSFGPDDALHDTLTADWLLEQLGEIGQRFLAEPQAGDRAWTNPLGKGGTVVVREGASHTDLQAELHATLEAIELPALLKHHGQAPKIAIKTTFMLAANRHDPSPIVSPKLMAALCAWLAQRGCEVSLIDSRNVYDRFFANRTVAQVADYLQLGSPDIRIVDAQLDQRDHEYVRGLGQHSVCATWADADLRIVLGKLRGHPTGVAMLSFAALEGLGERHDAYIFGDRKADRETAAMMMADAFPPHVAMLDVWSDVPDGLLGMMGQPHPRQPMRLYASRDAVALDAVVARHIGAEPIPSNMLVSIAFDWFGDPREDTVVRGPDEPIGVWDAPDHSRRSALLARMALPVYTHASAQGSLFVPHMDAAAFPEIDPAGTALKAARSLVRALTEPEATVEHGQVLLPVTWERHDGRLLRVCRIGEGPPVVLLHGYPETLQIWSRMAPILARGHQVIAFDWPGQGYSEQWGEDAGPAALADMLENLLDAWGLDTVQLVGQDMGGQPALLFAATRPERVRRVVVMNSLLFADGPTSPEIALMRRSGLQRTAFAWTPGLVYRQCKRTFLPAGTEWPDELDADFTGAFHRPAVRAWLSAMCDAYEIELASLPEHYWKITAPVLALWAQHDHHFPLPQAERLCALLPEARLTTVPDGTHWMSWARSEWVAAAIDDFLEKP